MRALAGPSTPIAAVIIALAQPAAAQPAEIISSYTSTASKDCQVAPPDKSDPVDGFFRVCRGMGNLIVTNSESDLREVVSVGRTRIAAAKEPAADTWFGPFNS